MDLIEKRQQQVLYDKKWITFLKRTWLFRHIPFVEFALAAGSMATGNVHPDSDFDVIVGARAGRIFTARFFTVLAFGLFGWRRKKLHGAIDKTYTSYKTYRSYTADKICLNHFVTEKSYRLSPPHNQYWKDLYTNLVPVYGAPEKINRFFDANQDWTGAAAYIDDLRHPHRDASWAKRLRERLLGGRFGDWVEGRLKALQVARIERSFKKEAGFKPRVRYTDEELEFHPDTRRIENFKPQP